MAKARKTKKKAGPGKKSSRRSGRCLLFLLFFLLTGAVVFWQRGELLTGAEAYLGSPGKVLEIRSAKDLTGSAGFARKMASVHGIPDYESPIRFPSGDRTITCFRMTGFQDRLIVCTERNMKPPEEIEDIIRKRMFVGRIVRLEKSRFRETLKSGFYRTHKFRPSSNAGLLLVGDTYVPSRAKTALLACCALLCILFLLKFILSLR